MLETFRQLRHATYAMPNCAGYRAGAMSCAPFLQTAETRGSRTVGAHDAPSASGAFGCDGQRPHLPIPSCWSPSDLCIVGDPARARRTGVHESITGHWATRRPGAGTHARATVKPRGSVCRRDDAARALRNAVQRGLHRGLTLDSIRRRVLLGPCCGAGAAYGLAVESGRLMRTVGCLGGDECSDPFSLVDANRRSSP